MLLTSVDIESYCTRKSSVPSKYCIAIAKYTRKYIPGSQMLIGPLEASLLGLLLRLIHARRVLEIGCFTGYSALAMAESLPKNGKLITLDINPETNLIARKFWNKSPHGKKIEAILGPALQSLKKIQGKFDLIFIDADKANYSNYFKESLKKLNTNGLIVIDNCLWSGRVLDKNAKDVDTKAIQKLNDSIKKQPFIHACLLPIRDGIFMIWKDKTVPQSSQIRLKQKNIEHKAT
ncbi:MAG: class I SAM-dependent methyltransferase [Chlamydiota bacterium]|nr:class I SAM-dependent methyltransferase [Chlamydiota bacterium]